MHGWFSLPPTLPLKPEWDFEGISPELVSLVDVSFGIHGHLLADAVWVQVDGLREGLGAVAEVFVDEAGRELTEPMIRERDLAGKRKRVLFVIVEPAPVEVGTSAACMSTLGRIGRVVRLAEAPPLRWLPPARIEPLALKKLGPLAPGQVRWALLIRYLAPRALPGVSPFAPRLVQGGWEAQPGAAFQLGADGSLVELTALPPEDEPLRVLYLVDTGPDFEPEALWPGAEDRTKREAWVPPGATEPLPSEAALDSLSKDALERAMRARVVPSGVP